MLETEHDGLQLSSSSSELWQIALLLQLLLESQYCDVVFHAVTLLFTAKFLVTSFQLLNA